MKEVDPRLISYIEWPCICGTWLTFGVRFWHRLVVGHWPKQATRINVERRFVAADGEVGSVIRSQRVYD